jgi:anti-sigma regulatory factor (Ser/Thr protein kinase)
VVADESTGAGALDHGALMYSRPNELIASATDFCRSARSNDASLFIAARQGNLDALRSVIERHGGPVTVTDLTAQSADPGRILGLMRMFARDNRSGQVYCWQDVGWPGRPAEEIEEAVRYEALFCRAFAGSCVNVMCSYDAAIGKDLIEEVERAHTRVFRRGDWLACFPAAQADAGFDRPLSRPPRQAATLTFREDQSGVRSFAVAQARQAGLSAVRTADLMIAVGELAGNTFVHTSGQGTFAIWVANGEVVFQVSDSGCIDDPLAGTLRPAPTAAVSRRGLWLVHQVGDLVQTRTGRSGTTIRVHMHLPG